MAIPSFKILPVPYHQQEENTYCGAACTQMIMHAPPLNHPLDDPNHTYWQDNLYTHITTPSVPGWVAAPQRMAGTLNAHGGPFPSDILQFRVFPERSPLALTRRAIWSIYKHGMAPAVLVWGKLHWVIIIGYCITDRAGSFTTPAVTTTRGGVTTGDDYVVQGLMIHNPAPVMAVVTGGQSMPPPHANPHDISGSDYTCGQGVVMVTNSAGALRKSDRGAEAHHVSYIGWQCEYLNQAVRATDGEWAGRKYIAVCATDLSTNDRANSAMPDNDRREHTCPVQRSTPISEAEAVDVAWNGMREHKLETLRMWYPVLDEKRPGKAEPVDRIYKSQPKAGYYLIPFMTSGGRAPVVAIVDMYSPTYIESLAVGGTRAVVPPDDRAADVRQMEILLDASGQPFTDANQNVIIPRDLTPRRVVWKPCLQSFSPFHPFYEFKDELGDIFYVRVHDQVAFRKLDSDIAGGH